MSEIATNKGTTLVKNGKWNVPACQRPSGWESMGVREPEEIQEPNGETEEPISIQAQIPIQEDACPVPPMECKDALIPILDGLLAGIEARKTLLKLMKFCMELEAYLETNEIRKVVSSLEDK